MLAWVAPAAHDRWRDLFATKQWTRPVAWAGDDVDELVRCLHELGVVVPFDWASWYSPDRYPAGRGLGSCATG